MSRLPCPPARWAEFSRLLDQGLELAAHERGPWLERLRQECPDLVEPLENVLAEAAIEEGGLGETRSRKTEGHLEGLPWDLFEEEESLVPGTAVGPYTLEAELGIGGMGTVWRARRSDGAYQRQVALKLPHPHLLGRGLRARFRRERDILARLSHPNIAQFLDAGVATDGRPYLALELVEGQPITEAARLAGLDVGARLRWFRAVLDAVAYAHARLVVHRDLKPSNVLVGADGLVKLLDFGIAKLLDATVDGVGPATQLTGDGARLATPDYAAPEQLEGGEITVATDVWALGVLLFELLAGRRPFDRARSGLVGGAGEEMPLASSRVDGEHATVLGLSARALANKLQGDLDAILAKALAHDPTERYASAEAFAADLDRFANLEPIVARRVGRIVRARLFARRHRLGLALSGLLVLSVCAGVAGVVLQARATAAQARRAEATKEFLVEVFKGSDPRVARAKPRGEITARELLDIAAGDLEGSFADDPETRIELLELTATIYTYLDEIGAARKLAALGRAEGQRYLAPDDQRLLDTWILEVWLALEAGDLEAARARLAEVDKHLGEHHLDRSVHRAGYHLAASDVAAADGNRLLQQRELEQAVAVYAAVAPRDSGHAATLSNLGLLRFGDGDAAGALDWLDRALVAVRATDSDVGVDLARIQARRGRVLLALGRLGEAATALDAALSQYAATVGEDHVTTWAPRAARARVAAGLGANAEADRHINLLLAQPDWREPRVAAYRQEAELHIGLALAALGREAEASAMLEAVVTSLDDGSDFDAELRLARSLLGDE